MGATFAAALSRAGRPLATVANSLGPTVILSPDRRGEAVALGAHPRAESIALSPDGRWVATGTRQGSGVNVWDVPGRKLATTLPIGGANVSFTPDGRRLVTASRTEYQFWEVGSWRPGLRLP